MYSLCHCFSDIQAVLLYMDESVKEVRHIIFCVSLFL